MFAFLPFFKENLKCTFAWSYYRAKKKNCCRRLPETEEK